MRFRVVFEAALCLGAILAVVGGASIGVLHIVAPELDLLPRLENGYRHIVFGFLFLTLFAVGAALLQALSGATRKEEAPPSSGEAPEGKPAEETAAALAGLQSRYHEMKTYVDLEMWELALEKANKILADYPGTREAELVSRNINELRWKAEPKFVSQERPISTDQEKQLKEKGLAQMYQHVKTYMELEMWELARQKALTIIKNFPDAPESAELMKTYKTLETKAREAAGAAKAEPQPTDASGRKE